MPCRPLLEGPMYINIVRSLRRSAVNRPFKLSLTLSFQNYFQHNNFSIPMEIGGVGINLDCGAHMITVAEQ